MTENKGGDELLLHERTKRHGKKNHKAFFCTIVKRSEFHQYRTLKFTCINGHSIFCDHSVLAIIFVDGSSLKIEIRVPTAP